MAATPAAEQMEQITIGPIRNGYIYTKIEPGLWRGARAAAGYPVPTDNHVLFLCQHNGLWLAVHADASASTITEVLAENRIIFGSHDDDITTPGQHKWDTWNGEDWDNQDNFYFETTRR